MAKDASNARRYWRSVAVWAAITLGLVAVYANPFVQSNTFHVMGQRWFPAWRRAELGLYDKIMEGQSYYTHAPLVPLVSLVIAVLLVRHTQVPVRPRRGLGLAVLAGSLGIHLAASFARITFASGYSLLGVLAGLVLFFWGWGALRRLWFPWALLFFMVPLPEVSIGEINFRLKMVAAEWGVGLANLLGIVAERMGNQVFLADGKSLVIANVCNGLRTLISLLAFGAIYAYVCKLRGGWRLGLFALSVPVALISNTIRVGSLVGVADVWDTATATGWYHDVSGLLIYAVAFGFMFSLEKLILWGRAAVGRPANIRPLFGDAPREDEGDGQWDRLTEALGGGRGVTCAAILVGVGAATWWLSLTDPPRWDQETVQNALPEELEFGGRRWRGYELPLDEATLTILEWPDYLQRHYVAVDGQNEDVSFCVIFSKDNRLGIHPPDMCIEGSGQEISHKGDVVLRDVPGHPELQLRELVVHSGPHRIYFLYCYRCGDRYTTSFYVQQLQVVVNGLLHRDAGGALVRVTTEIGDDLNGARRRAAQLMAVAIPHLDRALDSAGGGS